MSHKDSESHNSKDKSKDKRKDKKDKTRDKKHKDHKSESKPAEESTIDILQDKSKQTGIKHYFETKDCPIEFVTVYSDRAEVTRHVTVNIEKEGVQEVIIKNIIANVVEDSVRVSGAEGDAVILEVSYDTRTEKVEETNAKNEGALAKMKQLEELNYTVAQMMSQLQRLKNEENWMEYFAHNKISVQRTDPVKKEQSSHILPLDDAAKLFAFYRRELERVQTERFNLKQKMDELQEKIDLLQKEISAAGGAKKIEEKREIVIVVYAKSKKKLEMQVSYVVTGASFSSSYDVRITTEAKDTKGGKGFEKVQLVYYASVINNTSEDWKDVKLSISTAAPSTAARPPPLRTLYVRAGYPSVYGSTPVYKLVTTANVLMPPTAPPPPPPPPPAALTPVRSEDASAPEPSPRAKDLPKFASAAVETGTISQTFTIERKCNIASDNKPHKVTIGVIEVEAKFYYTAIPVLDEQVYLRAKAKNTSSYHLLKGPMNVFSDGVLVAFSELPQTSPDAEFDVFLGVDPSVRIQFRPVKKTEKTSGMIFTSKTEVVTHNTIIKNQKNHRIDINLFDQLPLSEDDKIKVKVLEPPELKKESNDNQDVILNDFNNVRWSLQLEPNEEKKIVFRYSIEYPSDRELEFYSAQTGDNVL